MALVSGCASLLCGNHQRFDDVLPLLLHLLDLVLCFFFCVKGQGCKLTARILHVVVHGTAALLLPLFQERHALPEAFNHRMVAKSSILCLLHDLVALLLCCCQRSAHLACQTNCLFGALFCLLLPFTLSLSLQSPLLLGCLASLTLQLSLNLFCRQLLRWCRSLACAGQEIILKTALLYVNKLCIFLFCVAEKTKHDMSLT